MADNTNTTSSFRFRIACEECHTRKIKCYPSLDDNCEACEACRVNQRKCLFSLKSKLGRPRKMNRNHSTPTNNNSKTSGTEMTTVPFPMETALSSRPDRISAFSERNLQRNFRDQEDLNMQLDQQSTLQKQPDMVDISSYNLSGGRPRTSMERNEELRARIFKPKRLERVEGSPEVDCMDSAAYAENYEEGMPSTSAAFSHESIDFSMNDLTDIALEEFEASMFADFTSPQTQVQLQVDQNPTQRTPEDHQEMFQLYSEVFKQGRMFSNKQCNLFAETNQDDLQQMISILQRISARISALFKTSPGKNLREMEDQGIAMVILGCVIQAVENIGKFLELDGKNNSHTLGTIMPTLTHVRGIEGMYMNHNPTHTQSLSNLSSGSINSDDGRGGVSHLRLELIMVVTRLDFLLMQFKAFVANFNSLVTVVSISAPSQMITNLQNLHQKLESVLEKLKIEWV